MDSMLLPLKKYAEFEGRARRSEYWLFFLFVFIVTGVLETLAISLSGIGTGHMSPVGGLLFGVLCLFSLAVFVPNLAVSVRRLHDTNRSGWWILINFVPFLGIVVYLIFMILEGTSGPNQYGPDPKGGAALATAAA